MANLIGQRLYEIVEYKDWTKRNELEDDIRHRQYKTEKRFYDNMIDTGIVLLISQFYHIFSVLSCFFTFFSIFFFIQFFSPVFFFLIFCSFFINFLTIFFRKKKYTVISVIFVWIFYYYDMNMLFKINYIF